MLSTLLFLNIVSIFIHLDYSMVYQIGIGVVIVFALVINIFLAYSALKEDSLLSQIKTNIIIILFFVGSCIAVLPYEIKIRAISFNYSDCITMIFSYLCAATALLFFTVSIHQKFIHKQKTAILLLDLVLLLNITILFVRAMLLCFGIYLDKNFIFLYANLS